MTSLFEQLGDMIQQINEITVKTNEEKENDE